MVDENLINEKTVGSFSLPFFFMPIANTLTNPTNNLPTRSNTRSSLKPVFLLALCFLFIPLTSQAHFKLNLNIRIFHIDHNDEGVDLYLRVPMPYLVASLLGPEQPDGTRTPAPFTTHAFVDEELMHYLDISALQRDALSLGQLAADGHVINFKGKNLEATVDKVLVYSGDTQTPFSTLTEAIKSFKNTQIPYDPSPFVGDSVVDVLLKYRPGHPVSSYTLSSTLDPDLPGQEDTANLVLDYNGDTTAVHRINGLLTEPVFIDRSLWTAARTFVIEGVKHILGGYDHVLFVVCLVLGAATLSSLAWRVTGFTLGHSVTLTIGFFGFTPTASWFIPLVETGIALSIILAAVHAISSQGTQKINGAAALFVTTLIGLLHGLGFSFVLKELLGVTSSNIWISLLSFNLGVELGQLAIVLLIWPILIGLIKFKPHWSPAIRWTLAIPCIAIASIWTGQRVVAFIAAVSETGVS